MLTGMLLTGVDPDTAAAFPRSSKEPSNLPTASPWPIPRSLRSPFVNCVTSTRFSARAPLRVGSELREVRDLHVVPAEGVEQHLGVLLRPQVRHQRREELRRHPGVESHLAGLVLASCKISNVTTPLLEPSASWNNLGVSRTSFICKLEI